MQGVAGTLTRECEDEWMGGWRDGEGISRNAGTDPAGRCDGCAPKSVSGAGGFAKLNVCGTESIRGAGQPYNDGQDMLPARETGVRDCARSSCPHPKRTHAQIDAPDDSRRGGAQTRSSILEARFPQATSAADGVLDIVSWRPAFASCTSRSRTSANIRDGSLVRE
ncbi:hypothetical protein L226DRAFT_136238 [Lentinus tigrinus ALCF2SS1-7]|uniref:uncharacterized protein n=1 Tax=Lentinus tigrinus ALCF2SS1-7 TaxID=1328758 RepID=UPI001165F6D3|nr:hypothetical protein L226DRAFT_136238 [Lentinus tigrinus ALCF2SS1-7]